MARPRKEKSDTSYNARRRYYRSAERNLKKAEKASGANAARYRALARQDLEDALNTYDPDAPKQNISKPIRNIAAKLGIDIEAQRGEFIAATEKERARAVERSEYALEGVLSNEAIRREREAYQLLNNPLIGRRIIGGFVDIWRDEFTGESGKFDKSKIIPVLFDYFKVNSLADLLEKIEKAIGEDLFKITGDADVMYETVKILIQTKVADNTITA